MGTTLGHAHQAPHQALYWALLGAHFGWVPLAAQTPLPGARCKIYLLIYLEALADFKKIIKQKQIGDLEQKPETPGLRRQSSQKVELLIYQV